MCVLGGLYDLVDVVQDVCFMGYICRGEGTEEDLTHTILKKCHEAESFSVIESSKWRQWGGQ